MLPNGKNFKEYIEEIKKCKYKGNNYGFCNQPGYSAPKYPYLCLGLRDENQKLVSDAWVYYPRKNKTNWKEYGSDKKDPNKRDSDKRDNKRFDTDKSIPISNSNKGKQPVLLNIASSSRCL